jgi:hypothetical protein
VEDGKTTVFRVEGLGPDVTVRSLAPDTVEASCADPERFWRGEERVITRDGVLEAELAPYTVLFIHETRS